MLQPMLQPVQHRGFVRPHAAPPLELLVNSVDLPSIIGRARSNTVSTPQSCPLDARATLQYVRRQVSRLERENAELQAENVCLQASNKRLRSENAHLQDDNAGLQRAASEARLDNWQKLHESDRQLEAAQSTTESLRAALEDAKQELAHRTTAMSELQKNLDVTNGVVQAVCTQQQDAFAASLQRAHSLTREASQRRKQPGPSASPAEPPSRRASEPVEPVEAHNYNLYLERGRMPNYDPSGGSTGSEGARHPSLRPELADRWRTAKRSSTASSGSSVGRPSKNAMARGEDQDQDDGE